MSSVVSRFARGRCLAFSPLFVLQINQASPAYAVVGQPQSAEAAVSLESLLGAATFVLVRSNIMQSDWKDRKSRFPINYLFDGRCLYTAAVYLPSRQSDLATFECVRSRIEFAVFFVLFLGVFDTRESGKSDENCFVSFSPVLGGLRPSAAVLQHIRLCRAFSASKA